MTRSAPSLPPARAPRAAVLLVGSTASGKTAVAHILAERTGYPILSTDSMQVYRGMNIGTAKPTAAEQRRLEYRGLDLADPDQPFSTGAYLEAVAAQLRERPGDPLILCGGTGLYMTGLARGLDRPASDPAVRRQAEARFEQDGLAALQDWLRTLDPARYAALADPKNPRRLIRAIELAHGKDTTPPAVAAPRLRVMGLAVPDDQLRQRIRLRLRRMLDEGWMDEARALRVRYPALSPTAATAIGYREIFEVLEGRLPMDDALEAMEIRTRRYAKRQRTWFRGQFDTEWIDAGNNRSPEAIADDVESRMRRLPPLPLAGLRLPGDPAI